MEIFHKYNEIFPKYYLHAPEQIGTLPNKIQGKHSHGSLFSNGILIELITSVDATWGPDYASFVKALTI
jgi:hypothetical protein